MKLLFDFLPIVAFFIAYKFAGIYIATTVAMAISLLQVITHWMRHRSLPGMQLVSLILIAVFGGSTLLMHNEIFIKWKPTALNWVLALAFLGSQLLSNKPFIQRLMEDNITLPTSVWRHLNLAWVIFFGLMGLANILVAYNFDTNTWVNFKLFGLLGLTLFFAVLQAFYLAKYINEKPEKL